MKEHIAQVDCYYVAHNPSIHYGKINVGQRVQTGQANLNIYTDYNKFLQSLMSLGVELWYISSKTKLNGKLNDDSSVLSVDSNPDIYYSEDDYTSNLGSI